MDVNAGELSERIAIIRRVRDYDADGYEQVREQTVRRPWAKVTQKSGTEVQRENAEFGEERVRFLVRWTKTLLDRTMFVRWAGDDYEIEYVNGYGGMREYIELWGKRLSRKAEKEVERDVSESDTIGREFPEPAD